MISYHDISITFLVTSFFICFRRVSFLFEKPLTNTFLNHTTFMNGIVSKCFCVFCACILCCGPAATAFVHAAEPHKTTFLRFNFYVAAEPQLLLYMRQSETVVITEYNLENFGLFFAKPHFTAMPQNKDRKDM